MDPSTMDWTQFTQWNNTSFQWAYGITPLTNWQVIAITWVVYLSCTFIGNYVYTKTDIQPSKTMRSLRGAHNMFLCLWSLLMCAGITYDSFFIVKEGGWKPLFCTTGEQEFTGRIYYWSFLYFISKFYELLDTAFIVANKKTPSFLHVYHHTIVVLMVWIWMQSRMQYHVVGVFANTFVHVIMYYYYYLISNGIKPWWKMYITAIQITQFVASFVLSVPYLYYVYNEEGGCDGFYGFVFSAVVNFTFLVQFIQLYLANAKAKKLAKQNQEKETKKGK
eukprot:TRINITY_DN12952_c0_g1_i2.p1 TRINITY_DN12952_c0_g1~~TRINITY_DN12952_c0_g1_i2.p1  ORF type:complete len:291 (+),score=84.17 TRINITY_DN12952_c0_g1_i2:43-873(+)